MRLAILSASKGKTNRYKVKEVLNDIDFYIEELYSMLKNEDFKSAKPKDIKIYDKSSKKERVISVPQFFPDQCIHWALMLQLKPIIIKSLHPYCCASIEKRGGSYAQKKIDKIKKSDVKNTKYYIKFDIKKCYPSIKPHFVLKSFERKIKDKKVLNLISEILSVKNELPIGFYTSQWFANFLLSDIDHKLQGCEVAKYYFRYIDDVVIFGSNKKKLRKVLTYAKMLLSEKELTMKNTYQLYNFWKQGLYFVGIRFFKNYNIIRKSIFLKIKRLLKTILDTKLLTLNRAMRLISYWGWIKRTNLNRFYTENIKKYNLISLSRNIISKNIERVVIC